MAQLTGNLIAADGSPLANYQLILVASKTSSSVVKTADVVITLNAAGAYSFNCRAGEYIVSITKDGRETTVVGKMTVYADSSAGSLNDFLISLPVDELTPEIIRRVQDIIDDANASAADVVAQVAQAREDLTELSQEIREDFANQVTESVEGIAGAAAEVEANKNTVVSLTAQNQSYLAGMAAATDTLQQMADNTTPTYSSPQQGGAAGLPSGTIFRVAYPQVSGGGFVYYRATQPGLYELVTSVMGMESAMEFRERLDAYFRQVATNQDTVNGNEEIIYAIRDSSENLTWIQISSIDGGPTQWAADMMKRKMGIVDSQRGSASNENLAYAVVDNIGNVTDLAIRETDGQFADFVVSRLALRIAEKNGGGGSANIRTPQPDRNFAYLSSCIAGMQRKIDGIPGPGNPNSLSLGTGRNFRITEGDGYVVGKPAVCVIYCGGLNGTNIDWRTEYAALKGFNMIWAAGNFNGMNKYGAQSAIDDYDYLVGQVMANYNIGQIILFGNSMGAMTALNGFLLGRFAIPTAIYLTDPMCNLADRWDSERKEIIRAAYGINASGSDYATKTAGYDPILHRWEDYLGTPIRIIASTGDTTVPYEKNAKMLYDLLSPHQDCTMLTLSSAGHNTADRYDVLDFANWMTYSVTKAQSF